MGNLNFNAAEVEPQAAFEPLPNGWYNVMIEESEMKPTKAEGGAYLELTMVVIDGEYAKRKLFDRLNVQNSNEVAQEIAYQTLSAICHAVGVIQVNDSQELHGKPLMAKVRLKPAEGEYEANNDIKGYKACDGSTSSAGTNTAGAAAGGEAAPAWAKKKESPAPEAAAKTPAKTPSKPAPKVEEPAEPVYEMTEAAQGFSREAYHGEGWTDEQLVAEGMMVQKEVVKAAPKPTPKPTPKPKPAAKPAAKTETAAATDSKPPWAQKK